MDDYDRALVTAMLDGANINESMARELEQHLLTSPDDLEARIKVTSFYSRFEPPNGHNGIKHILWTIKNRPDLCPFVVPVLAVDERRQQDCEQIKAAWLEQLEKQPANLTIIKNAAVAFHLLDESVSIELLKQALVIAPNDPDVQSDLANEIQISARFDEDADSARKKYGEAYLLYEQVLTATKGPRRQFYKMTDVAITALAAGKIVRAAEVAGEMLDVAHRYTDDWNYGNAIYWGNIVLGKIALRQHNLESARQYLLSASETTGSPQLNSYGPEFDLCSEILKSGETECVKTYLKNCAKFWDMDDGQLGRWLNDLEVGKPISFENDQV